MSHAARTPHSQQRTRTRLRSSFCLTLLAALLACAYLTHVTWSTEWGMDADEAVHSVEGLRLYDRISSGELGGFLRDTWFPERWAPPVNPHVRWYPFVHAWAMIPAFALLGPSDFSARLPSIVFLLGTVLVFFELGRRLAPRTAAASGLLAALLLLAAPNVLTFSAQSLTEPASLFFSFLALLAYVVSLERGHPRARAAVAGGALAVAMLTKYDHGGLLALCLGIAELLRHRFRVDRMLRSGVGLLFLIPLFVIVVWFAHPDKLAALGDSVSHPFAGSSRLVFLDFFLTWVTEYGSSVGMGALAVLAFFLAFRAAGPAVRAVWIWALVTAVFLGLRSRFHFRYNFVEAPIFLLLAAVVIPDYVERVARLSCERRRVGLRIGLGVAGLVLAVGGTLVALSPASTFEAFEAPFSAFHGLRDDHWGMSLEPRAYVEHFATHYDAFALYLGASCAALGVALALLGLGGIVLAARPAEEVYAPGLVWTCLAVALVPGVVRLYANLERMVEWELESHPELNALHAFVNDHVPPQATVLLGGGWDQLTNNGLRWYRLTRGGGEPRYGDVEVVGDMIGSLVFPPEPRIRHWAQILASAPGEELPDRVVIVEHDAERFLYRTRMGPEAGIYRDLMAARGGFEELGARAFDTLGVTVRVFALAGDPGAAADAEAVLAAHGVEQDTRGNASRVLLGEDGWSMRDESLRHYLRR